MALPLRVAQTLYSSIGRFSFVHLAAHEDEFPQWTSTNVKLLLPHWQSQKRRVGPKQPCRQACCPYRGSLPVIVQLGCTTAGSGNQRLRDPAADLPPRRCRGVDCRNAQKAVNHAMVTLADHRDAGRFKAIRIALSLIA